MKRLMREHFDLTDFWPESFTGCESEILSQLLLEQLNTEQPLELKIALIVFKTYNMSSICNLRCYHTICRNILFTAKET